MVFNTIDFIQYLNIAKRNRMNDIAANRAMQIIATGYAPRDELREFLLTHAISIDGVDAPTLAGLASAVLECVIPIPEIKWAKKLDIVGTGGGVPTFNISTAASILLSAVPHAVSDEKLNSLCVTKHGNRAVASKSGSADVLEKLGIKIDLSPEKNVALLDETRFAFFFAQKYHTAFSRVNPIRLELAKQGIRTAFNLIGPLVNPARANYQLVGFFSEDKIRLGAETLDKLGVQCAFCVCGTSDDGKAMDEVSPCGLTRGIMMKESWYVEVEFVPEDFGLKRVPIADLSAADAETSADMIRKAFTSPDDYPSITNAILINSAAAILLLTTYGFKTAIEIVTETLKKGEALKQLERIVGWMKNNAA